MTRQRSSAGTTVHRDVVDLLLLHRSGGSMHTRTAIFAALASLSLSLVGCGGSSDSATEIEASTIVTRTKNAARTAPSTSRPPRPTMTTGPARTDGTNCRTQDSPYIDPKTKAIYCLGISMYLGEYFSRQPCKINQTYVIAYGGPGSPINEGGGGCLDNAGLSAFLDRK